MDTLVVQIKPFKPRPPDAEDGTWRMQQSDAERVQEEITITDNAIIPLKERVVDKLYDPLTRLLRVFRS